MSMGTKRLSKNTHRVNLAVDYDFWTKEVQTMANLLTNGNKSLLVRKLLEAEMVRVTKEGKQAPVPVSKKVRGKSFGELFLKS